MAAITQPRAFGAFSGRRYGSFADRAAVEIPDAICQSVTMFPAIQQTVVMYAGIAQSVDMRPAIQQTVDMGCD